MQNNVIALGSRLRKCKNVITVGVFPNLSDYPQEISFLIKSASKIYYPTSLYGELFNTMGKNIFPSYSNYAYAQDKIKQTALFELLDIPHPRTKIFYGTKQKKKITDYFEFPFIAKIARGSAKGAGVFLIKNYDDLYIYLSKTHVAYIQEYLPINRDIRVLIIGEKIICSYWRIAQNNEFRTNVSLGGKISFDPIPQSVNELALYTAKKTNWNDVGIDICIYKDKAYVIEANMKYGHEGLKKLGIDYINLMDSLIKNGEI
ncbi:MAG: RimK family alpha-L-glutamate ligase [Desulfobacterales bacterium]|nr:RimK family alpha-L-glutamate ligase [Desulfobacterales bacterium]